MFSGGSVIAGAYTFHADHCSMFACMGSVEGACGNANTLVELRTVFAKPHFPGVKPYLLGNC